ncbi:hypothetical protein MesoLj113a_37270 [Mesorhizobium sp. 113-1-2]|jgi:hypothetical protein|uniref:bestrophin-like domain n=1 Tax=Mesorhizobium sp. 113-1-2 TaxID=2744515 RepID=UPI0008199F53|nr:DUF4239 domain-containing protein [Mesorhizobium sp. 113-1-2]BAV46181.1 hypothetical protein MLTONO_1278 [Mesorhizobium loti]BCG72569.1 hypothetical protein MesoLj113a_37270 [Mesorhizobium sp. 113-1-2]
MLEAFIAMVIFLCLAASAFASMAIWPRLPARHRDDDTNTVVRLAANLFGVMTSLILGLMINSAKNTFESIDHNVHAYATELILLDRTLRQYGPETDAVRQPLVAYVQRVVDTSSQNSETTIAANQLSERLLTEIGSRLNALTPSDAVHGSLLQDGRQRLQKVLEMRWVLIEQSEGAIPWPLIAMLVAWLALIFASFGFRAPKNAITAATLMVSAALIAGAIYLILDMDVAFSGPIQISSAPLERALAELQR